MASLADEIRLEKILEGGVRAFQDGKQVRKGVPFPDRGLQVRGMKTGTSTVGLIVSLRHGEPAAGDEDGEDGLTESFVYWSQEFEFYVATGAINCL